MTTWADEDGGADLGALDPTAGIGGLADPAEPAEPERSVAPITPAAVSSDWQAGEVPEDATEHSFFGIVTLWLDPAGRLAKIRITNRWRERLKGRQPLDQVILTGLKINQVRIRPPAAPDPRDVTVSSTDRIDQRFLDTWFEGMLRVGERRARLKADPDSVRPGRFVGEPIVGRDVSGEVEVRLGRGARTIGLTIDRAWAESSQVSALCDAVQQAHDAAYASFVEPQYEQGDYGEMAEELARFQSEAMSRARNHNPRGVSR